MGQSNQMKPNARGCLLALLLLLLAGLLLADAAPFAAGRAQWLQAPERPHLEPTGWPVRLRRQTSGAPVRKLSVGQLAAAVAAASSPQMADQSVVLADEMDEQTLKRQLPDLLVQAHRDKTLERALLKMIISASLRDANIMSQQQQQLAAAANAANSWQPDHAPSDLVPLRLESGELASLESQLASLGESELLAPVDKREYLKPCSFNAISCVRLPQNRKLK